MVLDCVWKVSITIRQEVVMERLKLGEMENKLADLIWDNAPVTTRELIELCSEVFAWKRTTTYTMLKRLCQRDLFENNSGTVIIKTQRADYHTEKGQSFLEESFDGSLPKFIAAFVKKKTLTESEIQEIQMLIDEHKED